MPEALTIPAALKPRDGRFGSGPSKVGQRQIDALVAAQHGLLGTSHRAAPVRGLVADVRSMLAQLFSLPAGYEVLLGNGGTTVLWDALTFGIIDTRSQHCAFGEFGSKFAAAAAAAPHLGQPTVIAAEPGGISTPRAEDGVDAYAWPHNETSTGAAAPVVRPAGSGGALVLVDATSAAGGIEVDVSQTDLYYFAPQKGFASDGGLWFAIASPAALARIETIAASGRYVPPSLSLAAAVDNSRAEQTLNTPAVATLVMMRAQLEWMLELGGLAATAARSKESTDHVYAWAEQRDYLAPFVTAPGERSPVVATVDVDDSIDAAQVRAVLRANGIVDVDPYRKLGRNQLRIGLFPAVDPDDARALTASVDWVVDNGGGAGTAA